MLTLPAPFIPPLSFFFTMDSIPKKPLKPGVVNLPGGTPASATLVADLVYEDFKAHHCFWNDQDFTNHLSHHILSLHDLGAPAECIQMMYDNEAAKQRPLHHNRAPASANRITQENWLGSLGHAGANMYPDYLAFFSVEISTHGVSGALERYVFSPEANGNGSLMLARFVASSLEHPMIQAGFGIEFGLDFMVAQGLAQAAVTAPEGVGVMDMPSGVPEIQDGPPTTLLELLREVYDSPKLAPPPYEKTITRARFEEWMTSNPERDAAICEIYAKWTFDLHPLDPDEYFAAKIEECMWQATLLLGATSKAGRKPRMDFILMHFLTGALLLRAVIDAVQKPLYKAQLLQTYARAFAQAIVLRGRPRIDPTLAMGYPARPLLPGDAAAGGGGSPWLPLLNNAALHPEAHVIKSMRTLFYCAQQYGRTPAGSVVGAVDAAGNETHSGAEKLDGTLFIRVAGALTEALGWVAHGEKEGSWDISGIGWEEAWSESEC
ncbi:hypothetical protein FB451DRAFT_1376001 [Mycena latifolia]|nr:hypothetical protein FB451DRAFT_1376001 [Mycena latifolia]